MVGSTRAQAEQDISAAGLQVGQVSKEYSNTVPFDEVMGQDPAAGTFLEAGGTVDLVVSLGDFDQPDIAEFTATPAAVEAGQPSILSWTSEKAISASLDQGIGDVPVNGSIQVYPESQTTYTLTVTGIDGTDTAQATVSVDPAGARRHDQLHPRDGPAGKTDPAQLFNQPRRHGDHRPGGRIGPPPAAWCPSPRRPTRPTP